MWPEYEPGGAPVACRNRHLDVPDTSGCRVDVDALQQTCLPGLADLQIIVLTEEAECFGNGGLHVPFNERPALSTAPFQTTVHSPTTGPITLRHHKKQKTKEMGRSGLEPIPADIGQESWFDSDPVASSRREFEPAAASSNRTPFLCSASTAVSTGIHLIPLNPSSSRLPAPLMTRLGVTGEVFDSRGRGALERWKLEASFSRQWAAQHRAHPARRRLTDVSMKTYDCVFLILISPEKR
ncbi:unnamed protein product [Pleuronectes platessa]|uniref:Uncharacterized protein n=1 Tax=Pleuronectes platessa TaxID=8262 RepID=A0A9N7VT00_PLEPL|nr:unnamed protein product [Pleuronectes platessa]